MSKRWRIGFLFFLYCSLTGSAQTDTIIEEEVVIKAPKTGADTANYFNELTEAEKSQVQTRQVGKSDLEKLRQDKAFWYADKVREAPKQQREESLITKLFAQRWFGILLWIIIISGFIGTIIWFLVVSNVSFFNKKPRRIQYTNTTIENENIFEINFEQELSKAMQDRNYKLAIRLMYLQTLKALSDRAVIHYRQERTNGDYLMQLYGTSYYTDFFRLTRHFEYAWYGQFPVSAMAFEFVSQEYTNFKNRLSR